MTNKPSRAVLWLAMPAILWLALLLRSAQVSVRSPDASAMEVIQAAIGLPAVISAALVAGAATGLAVLRLLAGRLAERPAARFAVALGVGLLIGVGSAAAVTLGRLGDGSAITVFGAAVAASATIGGALAGARSTGPVAAGVAASLGLFVLTFVRELFNSQLLGLFGGADTPMSLLDAQRRLGWVTGLVGGLAAGLIAYGYLRRTSRHSPAPPRTGAYLLAGAGAGLMLLLTEVITRLGGGRLLSLARSVSEGDKLFQDLAGSARLNSALIVLFIGALTAMIAYGRTIGPRHEADDEPQADHAEDSLGAERQSNVSNSDTSYHSSS